MLSISGYHDFREIDRIHGRGKTASITIYEVFESEISEVILLKRQSKNDFEKPISHFHEQYPDKALAKFEQISKQNLVDLPAPHWCAIIKKARGN